ncbi:MAG: AraC family transcriptional regulator [Gemmatimonadota bacterium]|nr:AraC family transcriptional regulator [Gemmatimonadota bacterium]
MLTRGQLFGTTVRTRHIGDLTVSESRYLPHTCTPMHAHELPMFVLVVDGSFDEQVEMRARSWGPRRLMYRPPGERHAQRFLSRGSTCLTIELPAAAAAASLRGADGRADLAGMPTLLALRAYDEWCRPDSGWSLAVEEVAWELTARAARMRVLDERRRPAWLRRMRELIEARLAEPLRLGELAREAAIHRVHLSRTFRRFHDCGLGEYVRRLRVHDACSRIRAGGGTMSTVAAAVGFSDESHMGRAFREVLGFSPRTYASACGRTRRRPGGGPPPAGASGAQRKASWERRS